MKKAFIFILIIGLIGGLFFFRERFLPSPSPTQPSQESTAENQGIFGAQTSTESIPETAPQRLIIEDIGVNAAVESVGMNEKGEMAVPQNDMNVAWYNLGYKPGANGSAVIAGHFDTRTGGAAVFYNLDELTQGDEITVTYPNGQEYTFTVTSSARYPYNNFPLERVFNTKGQPTLNLITCDGVFDSASRNYSQRLVVYAMLQD